MKLLDKMEMKIGRYAIRNLMLYIVLGSAAVFLLCMFNTNFVYYLTLTPQLILRGQVWRLFTFLFIPTSIGASELLWVAISLYFYYFIGKMLERNWGAFRFNVYYLIGVLCTIVFSMISQQTFINDFLNESLFLAFATLYPEQSVLLFFFLPIKVKWMGWVSAALLLYQFIVGGTAIRLMITASVINYLIFFGSTIFRIIRDFFRYRRWEHLFGGRTSRTSPGKHTESRVLWSKVDVSRSENHSGPKVVHAAFHHCAVCGKTELDDPNMQFRYCAECDGAVEYCMDHLYNHTHIHHTSP